MTKITLEELGLQKNPFESIVANEETAFIYNLYGRKLELERFSEFILETANKTTQQRIMVMGEYGSGKTHHLLQLMHRINKGEYGEKFTAIYLGNLGISFRRLYEVIIKETRENIPELSPTIDSLPSVEPEDSVEQTYALEKLRDSVVENLGTLIANAQNIGIKGIFIIIDEAEDIVQSDKPSDIQYFVQCLVHFINKLGGTPLHIIMGFSREAMERVTTFGGDVASERQLGDAFIQRFPKKIQLGYLSVQDAELMILERLNKARFTENDSFYPIKKEVIGVVSKLVSGHPREILAIMDQSLHESIYAGEREITGTEILRVLAKHESYYSKSFILDWSNLNEIIENISTEDEVLGNEFKMLSGKLLGEDAILTEDDFSDPKFPEYLTKPIGGIRVLERKTSNFGEIGYSIHEEVKNAVFKEKRYNSDIERIINQEIFDLITYPEKFQNQLTYGLWKVLQMGWKAEYNQKIEADSYLMIIGNVKPSSSAVPVTIIFAAYKGSKFPKELYDKCINCIINRDASFAYILYDGPRLEIAPEYQNIKNNLRSNGSERLLENILTYSADDAQIEKDQLLGQIKLLGNRDTSGNEKIDPESIFASLDIKNRITDLVENRALVYPEERIRKVVNYLATNYMLAYSIKELKENLGTDLYLDTEFLNTLNRQAFIQKQGSKWKISSLDDDPLWKSIYSFIYKNKLSSTEEIRSYLESQYVFQCPQGDENAMVNWYIELLIKMALIDSQSETHPPKYKIIDHSSQLGHLLQKCKPKIEELSKLIKSAEPMQISVSKYRDKLENVNNRYNQLENKYTPGNEDVAKCKRLFEEISDDIYNINRDINSKEKEQSSRYSNIKQRVEIFKDNDVDSALEEGIISDEEVKSWFSLIYNELGIAFNALELKDYSKLAISLNTIEPNLEKLQNSLNERKNSKQPCIEYSTRVSGSLVEGLELLEKLKQKGFEDSSIFERYQEVKLKHESEYSKLFNSSRYSEAKLLIIDLNNEISSIVLKLRQKVNDYINYEDLINKAKENNSINDPELQNFIDNALKAFEKWDFANVETQLKLFDKIRKEKTNIKLPEEKFKEKFHEIVTLNLEQALKEYNIDDIFIYLKTLYQKGEIKTIEIQFKK